MIKIATIAGSDASGGAGLEADLKTFAEYGLYGMAAVTLIATMDPVRDWAHVVFPLAEDALRAQLATVFEGVGVASAKSGMLGSSYAVQLTKEAVQKYGIKNYVLDPVMVCKGAGEPLNKELNDEVEQKLLPLALVVTPNIFEAQVLSGIKVIDSVEKVKEAARVIHGKGAANVYIKGGAKLAEAVSKGKSVDVFFDGGNFELFEAPLLSTSWTHGAGCTTSAAIAAGLARGLSVPDAVTLAKKFIKQSLENGFALNKWVGPGNPSAWREGFR
jgi:pyridoxine kinase